MVLGQEEIETEEIEEIVVKGKEDIMEQAIIIVDIKVMIQEILEGVNIPSKKSFSEKILKN